MIFLLSDDGAGRARLEELRRALGDESAVSLNTTDLDGSRLELGEMMAACDAMPFLSDRRLIIVRGALSKSSAGDGRRARPNDQEQALIDYLERVPPTSDLVFLEGDTTGSSAVIKAIERLAGSGKAEVIREPKLDAHSAADWVRQRARARGVSLSADAVAAIVDTGGLERRTLDSEIEKVSLLAGDGVLDQTLLRALLPAGDTARVFELMDAIGARNSRAAVRSWQVLARSGEDPHRLLALLGRQIRLLIQMSDMTARRAAPAEISREVGIQPFLVNKLTDQARRWPAGALERVLAQIVDLDHQSKTGGADAATGLEALVLELVAAR